VGGDPHECFLKELFRLGSGVPAYCQSLGHQGSPCSRVMPEHQLGLLKSLTMRPTRSVAANLTPVLSALHAAGYVTPGPEGWMATAAGCALIEQSRILGTNSVGA
jgi:hypothetical protein